MVNFPPCPKLYVVNFTRISTQKREATERTDESALPFLAPSAAPQHESTADSGGTENDDYPYRWVKIHIVLLSGEGFVISSRKPNHGTDQLRKKGSFSFVGGDTLRGN
jgi:hypothetical protein